MELVHCVRLRNSDENDNFSNMIASFVGVSVCVRLQLVIVKSCSALSLDRVKNVMCVEWSPCVLFVAFSDHFETGSDRTMRKTHTNNCKLFITIPLIQFEQSV